MLATFRYFAMKLPGFRQRSRDGSAADRGKNNVLAFPGAPAGNGGLTWLPRIVSGIIAGAADLDPAAVLTATVAGAAFGLSVGWVVLLCIPVLIAVFGVSARIGHETQLGLVRLVRVNFGRLAFALAALIVLVNVLMVIADILAVSEALSILLRQPVLFFPGLVAFSVWYILVLTGYARVHRTLSLLALFLLAYVVAAWISTDSLARVIHGLVVPLGLRTPGYVMGIIAVFGSLLTPDVIVWQTSSKRESKAGFHGVEATIGCVVAATVSLSVIVAASAMKAADISAMTTVQAAQALSVLGQFGPVLFAFGIIGSGFVALPILVASLCFSIAEAFDWPYGLSEKPWEAKRFFVLISFVLLVSLGMSFAHVNTVRTLYWSQVLAGIVIVPILFFILWISNDRRIVRTTNARWQNICLGGAVGGMLVANAIFLWTEVLH